MVGDSYDVDYDSYGTCSVIDLATGKNLPVPEGAYSCIVCGDMLVFTCYARPADLAADEWDDDSNLHSWVAIQQKDGTQTYGSSTSTASRISYESDELDNWVELDISHADGSPADQVLHNPATGEACAATADLRPRYGSFPDPKRHLSAAGPDHRGPGRDCRI